MDQLVLMWQNLRLPCFVVVSFYTWTLRADSGKQILRGDRDASPSPARSCHTAKRWYSILFYSILLCVFFWFVCALFSSILFWFGFLLFILFVFILFLPICLFALVSIYFVWKFIFCFELSSILFYFSLVFSIPLIHCIPFVFFF